ncbi:MAG TPA: response regulator [Pirellula sp.]|nr:response regulator [Pirellula sp.]
MTEAFNFTALVVDDDALIRQATARALRQEGFTCDMAENGVIALKKLQENSFDLAIVDLHMPEMNGHQLIVESLAMKNRPAIIVLTGIPDRRLVQDLFLRGVEDIVAKPVNYDILTSKAKSLVERRKLAEMNASETDRIIRQLRRTDEQELNDLAETPTGHDTPTAVDAPTGVDPPTAKSMVKSVSLKNLSVHCVLAENVLDAQNRLLVREGTVISLELMNKLAMVAKSVGVREPIQIQSQLSSPSCSVTV